MSEIVQGNLNILQFMEAHPPLLSGLRGGKTQLQSTGQQLPQGPHPSATPKAAAATKPRSSPVHQQPLHQPRFTLLSWMTTSSGGRLRKPVTPAVGRKEGSGEVTIARKPQAEGSGIEGGSSVVPTAASGESLAQPRAGAGKAAGSLTHSHQPAQEPEVGQAGVAAIPR